MPRATQASQRASSSRSASRHVNYDEPPPTRPTATATYSRRNKGKRPAAVIEDDEEEEEEEEEVVRAGPSGSRNANGGNTQARRRVRETDDEDDDEDGGSPGPNGTAAAAGNGTDKKSAEAKAREAMGNEAYNKKVNELVRLSLFYEYRKQPIRRDDVNKKILVERSQLKLFNSLVTDANKILKDKFGMELVELRPKSKGDVVVPGDTQNNGKKAANGGADAKKAANVQRMYILRSVLAPALLARLSDPKPIPFPENIPTDVDDDAGYVRNAVAEDCGAVLDWEKGDGGATGGGAACIGILFVVLGLILVHDRAMRDASLLKMAKDKLQLEPATELPFVSTDSTQSKLTFEAFLAAMVKQAYLEKHKLDTLGRHGEAQYEWRWGPRADAEIGERAVAEFMADIMKDSLSAQNARSAQDGDASEDDEPADGRGQSSRRNDRSANPEKARKSAFAKIQKAVGGELGGQTPSIKA